MKWLLRGAIAIVGLVALLFLGGALIPASHEARQRIDLPSPIATVWPLLRDLENSAEWNSLVDRMEPLAPVDGRERWLASGQVGELPTELVIERPPNMLTTAVDGGVFRGAWTYELISTESGTRVELTERGEIPMPLFRWFSLLNDEYASGRTVLTDLARHLGHDATPVPIDEVP